MITINRNIRAEVEESVSTNNPNWKDEAQRLARGNKGFVVVGWDWGFHFEFSHAFASEVELRLVSLSRREKRAYFLPKVPS